MSDLKNFIAKMPSHQEHHLVMAPTLDRALNGDIHPGRIQLSAGLTHTLHEAIRSSLDCVVIAKHLLSLDSKEKAVQYLDCAEHLLSAMCSQFTYLQRDSVFKSLNLNMHSVLPEAEKGILDAEEIDEATKEGRPVLFGTVQSWKNYV